MPTSPVLVPAGPAVPDSSNTEATFDAQWEAFNAWAKNDLQPGVNALATVTKTNADEAHADAVATAADRVQTGLDRVATAADRVQTNLDKIAAAASATSAAAIAGAFVGTSTTNLLIGLGSKTFVTQSGEQYTAGIWMTAVSNANSANWMFGQVTSYIGASLVLDVQAIGGSGTLASWNLSLTGARGATGPAGSLSGVATGTVELLSGAAIASAATVNLDTATGNRVHITGTTTITAVTLTRGPRTVIFDGILTLTHHATNNNLPGGANIITAPGDRAIYESDGTTDYCVAYVKANGQAVTVGAAPATPFMHVREEQSAGTNSQNTSLSSFPGTVRTINTVVSNTISGASLASDQLTLPAGVYEIYCWAPAVGVGNSHSRHQAYLERVAGSSVILIGTVAQLNGTSGGFTSGSPSLISGRFTLAATETVQIRHMSNAGNGGQNLAGGTGLSAVYTTLSLTKVA